MNGAAKSRPRVLYYLARADFLERARRYSFLVTLGFALYFGYLAAVGKIVLQVGHSRGVLNSAWIGALMALIATTFLSLFGFYFIKNTIERDRDTRVGQILASTPMTKPLYVVGKTLSNFAVLASMVLILAVSGIGMQFWRGEDPHIELWKLLAPFLLLALPAMAVVAAVAVVFETIPWLRGGFGNVVYFFVWTAGLALPVAFQMNGTFHLSDWPGLSLIWESMRAAAHASSDSFSFSLNIGPSESLLPTFRWNGVDWTASIILGRFAWVVVAMAIATFAALLFDRFDPARGKPPREAQRTHEADISEEAARAPVTGHPVLTPLEPAALHRSFAAIYWAEFRLMPKGQKWWWFAVAAGFLIAEAAVPSADARGILLACAWIWPVLLWSAMGVREGLHQTSQLLFSAPHPIARQLPAVWLAGASLAVITGSGFAVRLLAAGNARGLVAWLIGAIFIPTLALALGVWSGSSKPFEILYTLLWYVGPMHQVRALDFMSSAPATATTEYPLLYLLLACGLGVAAVAGRKHQLQA
jgi:hypothetical protein